MHACAVLADFHLSPPGGDHWALGAAAWILIALPLCLSGLGLIAARWLGAQRPEFLPVVGLAVFIFVGGLLNLLHIAFACSIVILLAVGFVKWARCAWRRLQAASPGAWRSDPEILLLGLLLVGIVALTASSQISPKVFNWHDDLQKYFAQPVRMLETGTVFGSPLSAMGFETLGGLAFFHSSVLILLPLQAINGADAVLGLLLCLLPLFALGIRNKPSRIVCSVAMASVVIIDPYYVNTSALFVGSALIMGAVLLTEDGDRSGTHSAAVGLIYAALVSLKPTFLVFAAPHLVLVGLAQAYRTGEAALSAKRALKTAAWTACFLSPWVALHLPHYLAPLAFHAPDPGGILHNPVHLTDLGPTPTGLTGLRAYTVLVGVLGILTLDFLGLFARPRRGPEASSGVVAAVLVTMAAYPLMVFIFPRVLGYADADTDPLRYFIPIALGVFPIALCTASVSRGEHRSNAGFNSRTGLCLCLGLAPLILFSGTAVQRFRDAATFGTFLPFPLAHEPGMASEFEYVLSREKRHDLLTVQERTPAGASIIAWINTPYFLDYSRNVIFDAEPAGIANRWANPPASDYILWEYRGSSSPQERTRRLAAGLPIMDRRRVQPLLDFDALLWARVLAGTLVFKNEEFLLVRSATARPRAP